ncbi:MAG: hypothetical protein V4713_16985 [Pseudomonadota bacterium]
MFDAPRKELLTQGTIFSCGYAENYDGVNVYGLIITARCDAAQKKVPIFSFIPVVPLTEWLFKDGGEIAIRRCIGDHENSIGEVFDSLNISRTVLRTTKYSDIRKKLLLPMIDSRKISQAKLDKIDKHPEIIKMCTSALDSRKKAVTKAALVLAKKQVDGVLKELAGNKLTGYYLLRNMPTEGENPLDSVALLREIHHIPSQLSERILSGIDKIDWLGNPIDKARCPIFISDNDYCVSVAKLRSPWIEHLMQSWSLLFTRIGVDDVDSSLLKNSLIEIGLESA